ncbi:MAG: Uma2 family endonuclease [Thermosynechococcaceae cyanobacterium]
MLATAPLNITWEKLPDDYVLDDDPVDNINQPALAAALTESLSLAGRLPETALTTTNYGICATLNGKMVVKAPDWAFVPSITVPRIEIDRSYTPRLQGDLPAIVMEFLSETEGGEYSTKPTYPPGKWFFYEQILKVRYYAIFSLETGALEVYCLDQAGRYQLCTPDTQGQYLIETMNLSLGPWQGVRDNREGQWLRWWDEKGEMLLWSAERMTIERQRTEQERQRAEQECQRADQLAAQLRAAGIEPES